MKQIPHKNSYMKNIELREGVGIEELLRRMYVDENKSTQNIADELHISYATIYKWLNLSGIYSHQLKF